MEAQKRLTADDAGLRMELTAEKDALALELIDTATGRRWGPADLMVLEIYDKALRREERMNTFCVDAVDEIEGGAHVQVSVPRFGVAVGCWVRLVKGELSVQLNIPEVYETDEAMYRLFAVDILPGLMTAGADGHLLLPVNAGLRCSPRGQSKLADRFLIYGEQDRWELTPNLPFCAAYDDEGGMIALATQGACDMQCRVAMDGQDSGEVGFAATLRRYWPDPVDIGAREIRFVPIPPKTDQLAFVARRIRKHVMEDLGKKTLAQRRLESPEVAYLLDAYIIKLFFAAENVGYLMAGQDLANPGSFQCYMTFAEAKQWLGKMHDAGIDRVVTQCVGWNARGHDGLYPTRFPIEQRLGGEAGFRDLIEYGHEIGYQIQVHDNFMMNTPRSPDWNPEYVTHDIYGEPLIHGCWSAGPECSSWPLSLPRERVAGHLERMKTLGLKGMYYLDYMQQPLEVNYHPRHKGPRAACARGQALMVEEARRVFGSAGVEFGFLPVAIPADHAATAGDIDHIGMCCSAWPISALLKRSNVVPLWTMVMHGLIVSEARNGVSWKNAMTSVLFGTHPRDEWSVRAGPQVAVSDARIAATKATHDLCLKRFGRLQLEEMTSWSSGDEGVQCTSFSDGTEVTADYAASELVVNGERIECPGDIASFDVQRQRRQ